ncbi:MAG: hypothetical protein WCL32_17685, partial [Planctomycetota bacterium]
GVQCLRQENWPAAIAAFDKALASEPDHFLARFGQAMAFLRSGQLSQAKIGVTACIGQKPKFAWNHVLRSEIYLQMADLVAAAQDLQFALELKIGSALRPQFDAALTALHGAIQGLPADERHRFWDATIATNLGMHALRTIPLFERLQKD